MGYRIVKIPKRGEEQEMRGSRWIVEASNSWLNNYKRIRVRCERTMRNYSGIVFMALAAITLNKIPD